MFKRVFDLFRKTSEELGPKNLCQLSVKKLLKKLYRGAIMPLGINRVKFGTTQVLLLLVRFYPAPNTSDLLDKKVEKKRPSSTWVPS